MSNRCNRAENGVTFEEQTGKYRCNKCGESLGKKWPDPTYGTGIGPCFSKKSEGAPEKESVPPAEDEKKDESSKESSSKKKNKNKD